WTSMGHYADWIFCLVRTDASSPKKQEGISFLLIDMKTPGITVRPLILLEETHHVNEVFFEDVKVPVENLVHEEGKGWTVAKHLLGHERLNTSRIGNSRREIERLKKLARTVTQNGRPLIEDPRFADRLARVEIELMALEISNLQFVDEVIRTGQISSMVSMLKIRGTDIQQAITELLMDAYGPQARAFRAIDHDGFDARAAASAPIYFNYRKTTIYAGSNEVQRNIISKAALGL
ncbi:MAG: pimeloyl-CoA dehydrogenase large subunit, partial [Burkholderiaceae bacterium]|nr:pimeloyl-CoA dehydrogenase large subunit [Burkholderiaceae bacterium]